MKNIFRYICTLMILISYTNLNSQEAKYKEVSYNVIAKGTDSPLPNLQIVCYNKYFNQSYLPANFREKYNLNESSLYKNKMLIEIFHSDKEDKGFNKIELLSIKEDEKTLIIDYKLTISNMENGEKSLAPFMIIQVPKSKKNVKFYIDGVELGKNVEVYIK